MVASISVKKNIYHYYISIIIILFAHKHDKIYYLTELPFVSIDNQEFVSPCPLVPKCILYVIYCM